MKISNEAKIGILVVVVFMILSYLTWEAGDFDFTPEGYNLKVHFSNIDGIELNAPVTVNGFKVGRVEDIQIVYGDTTQVELTLWVDQKTKINNGAQAYVKNMGFMGEKYVGLTSGDDKAGVLVPGSIIQGQEPGSFEKILAEGEIVVGNLKKISSNINERLEVNKEYVDSIILNMDTSVKNIALVSSNLNERLEKNEDLIDDFVVQMNSASRNFEEMSYDLKINPWKLMYKEPKKRKREVVKK